MSLITDALKAAAADEKRIAKQDTEITALTEKIESLKLANVRLSDEVRQGKEYVKVSDAAARVELRAVKAKHKSEVEALKVELKQVTAELKAAKKAPAPAPVTPVDAPKKRGRPRKSDLAAPEAYQAKDYGVQAPDVQIASNSAPAVSAKGFSYEYA